MEPIYLIDWKADFLQVLSQHISSLNHNTEDVLLVFPHSRPRSYFNRLLKKEKTAQLAPKILTFEEFIHLCSLGWLEENSNEIDSLESIQILFQIVKNLEKKSKDKSIYKKILGEDEKEDFSQKTHSFIHFYPYGQALSTLIHQCFENNTIAFNLHHTEEKVEEFMAYIFNNLKEITLEYKEYLLKNHKTNSAFKLFSLAEYLNTRKNIKELFQKKKIIFAGFNRLNKSEEIIFSYFAQKQAGFYIHSDPTLAIDIEKAHYSTFHHKKWPFALDKNFELINTNIDNETLFYFHQGYNTHSQLQHFDKTHLNNKSAIILNDYHMLMPLLGALAPEYKNENINISMGLPLALTQVSHFLESIIALHNTSKSEKEILLFESPALMALINQPLMCAFFTKKEQEEICSALLSGEMPFYSENEIKNFSEQFEEIFTRLIQPWLNITTLGQLIECCEKTYKIFFFKLEEKSKEKLALLRLKEKATEFFAHNPEKDTEYNFDFCMNLLKDILSNDRIPFKSHIIDAPQVMGLLESRLLSLENVHIFDANEDLLPASLPINPFVPDSLRPALGLPSSKDMELASAFNWYSLVASAKEVHIYWQENKAAGLLETKKTMSPLVRDIMWQQEKQQQKLLKPDNIIYTQAQCLVSAYEVDNSAPIEITKDIRNEVLALLQHNINVTMLNEFLQCPAKFFYHNICQLKETEIPEETEDYAKLGTLVHNFMENLYPELREYQKKELTEKAYILAQKKLMESDLNRILPAESFLLLTHSFPYRIRQYISNKPDKTEILAKEKKLQITYPFEEHTYILSGIIDRIDKREDAVFILDYKIGHVDNQLFKPKFWDSPLFFDIEKAVMEKNSSEILQVELGNNSQSFQLPFYMLLAKKMYNPLNAAFINLKEQGKEKFLLDESIQENVDFYEKFDTILRFLLLNIHKTSHFNKNIKKHCLWCSYKKYCI